MLNIALPDAVAAPRQHNMAFIILNACIMDYLKKCDEQVSVIRNALFISVFTYKCWNSTLNYVKYCLVKKKKSQFIHRNFLISPLFTIIS